MIPIGEKTSDPVIHLCNKRVLEMLEITHGVSTIVEPVSRMSPVAVCSLG